MSTLLPYSFTNQENIFHFTTDNGIYYNIEFSDASYYFVNFPSYLSVYEFNIKVIQIGEPIAPPQDKKVELTIVSILETFFTTHTNSILYICDNTDQRHHARNRKFDSWFKNSNNTNLEKHDNHFFIESIEIFSSLILHVANPFKQELINLFMNQPNELGKD